MLTERPEQHADHPESRPPQPRTLHEEEHGRRVERQRDRHAERPRQMPVVREEYQPQPVEPLQVDDLQLGGVEPVLADDAALAVEQIGQDHLRRKVRVDDPFAGHDLIPQIKQIAARDPEPRQPPPERMQHPALCLLFHSASPEKRFLVKITIPHFGGNSK